MNRSTDRLLTTHVGSLPRPQELLQLYANGSRPPDFDERLRAWIGEVVRRQADVGLDVVDDGEFGKPTETAKPGYGHGTWAFYIRDRLSGFEWVEDDVPVAHSKDRSAFSGFYGGGDVVLPGDAGAKLKHWTCTGPIEYVGEAGVARDVANLRAALDGLDVADAFVPLVSPISIASTHPNRYYASREEYAAAIAEAMRHEYAAIAEAGFVVQIDDPALAVIWDWWFDEGEEYRRFAEQQVELLNVALEGIPEEQVRYHLCWGSWQGPHSSDVPLEDVVDLILRLHVGAYSLEAANPRHEHEWKLWRDVKLPEGKLLVPGVVTHKTSVLEHPEVVADRLVRYAETVGRENVIAGTDCGMGGRIDPDLAWAKLAVLVEGAALASERLW
jgi:5-methyltetrahydropteroyltriglutamate--homocysteine methyltransferase